ncbi:helix-turn-helix domain-containing protein [Streptomyces sp. NPDC093510]|uniref:TetR/AcrR family transcriptional regulator n=1 Tax=Streptomyces sp. NPDC093510 TaxID=3155199 RepID=UPI0034476166
MDVAVRVFAKRGYHGASVDEIAELAGISKPMVYLYLDSKEGLFLACLRREADRLVGGFQRAADSLTDWMARHRGRTPEGVTLRLMSMVWVGMGRVLEGEVRRPGPAGAR